MQNRRGTYDAEQEGDGPDVEVEDRAVLELRLRRDAHVVERQFGEVPVEEPDERGDP